MKLIVAGSYQQAHDLATAREWPLGRNNPVWMYVWEPKQLRGMSGAEIIYTGDYYNNRLMLDSRSKAELQILEDRFEREAHLQRPYP